MKSLTAFYNKWLKPEGRMTRAVREAIERESKARKKSVTLAPENEFIKLFVVSGHLVVVQYLEEDNGVLLLVRSYIAGYVWGIGYEYKLKRTAAARETFKAYAHTDAIEDFKKIMEKKVKENITCH
ncbi:MAG: hypothetical protein ACK5LJ_17660 [Paracoccus sp. (in: a-proteobacteria)]